MVGIIHLLTLLVILPVAAPLTVVVDLPTAVGASLILASALLVKRLSEATQVSDGVAQASSPGQTVAGKKIPDGVMVFRIFGTFFFDAADKLEMSLRPAGQLPDVLICGCATCWHWTQLAWMRWRI